MVYYFIHMAAVSGLTLRHSIESIFMHFIGCMWSYLDNDITNCLIVPG